MQKTIYKICDETYHAIRVINSCKTIEQLENANRWACSLVDKWYKLSEKFSLYSGADVQRYIDSAASDMTVAIEKQKKYIKSQQNEGDASNHSKTKDSLQNAAKQKKRIKSKNL
jgi:hypothetical protein